jgi:hypothetical protein
MEPGRRLHEEEHLANDALALAGLLEQLEQAQPRRRRRRLKTGRAGIKHATVSTQTHATAEPKARGTTVFAAVSAGKPRKRHQMGHHRRSASTGAGAGRASARTATRATGYCQHGRQKGKCKDCGTGHGPLPARAPEAPVVQVQGLQTAGRRQQAIGNTRQLRLLKPTTHRGEWRHGEGEEAQRRTKAPGRFVDVAFSAPSALGLRARAKPASRPASQPAGQPASQPASSLWEPLCPLLPRSCSAAPKLRSSP